MARIPLVDAENEPTELHAVFEQLRSTRGRVPGMYRILAQNPAILIAHRAYFHAALDTGVLPRAFKERIVYKVVRLRKSAYSSGSHGSYALKHGVTAAELEAIDRADYSGFAPGQAAALEFAEAMTVSRGEVPAALMERLKSHFSAKEIVEIAAVAGLCDFACSLGTAFDLQPD